MQAPLSSTASGSYFHSGPLAVLPCFSAEVNVQVDPGSGSPAVALHLLPKHLIAEGAGLAHDAGNLLGALGLYCELLAVPGVLREEHLHYARALQMISGRSQALIGRLLNPGTTARPPAPNGTSLTLVDEQVVLPDVIEACRSLLGTVARRAVEVAFEAGSGRPVALSREALERILVNLTKNAAEASEQGAGRITLRVSCLRASRSVHGTDRIVLSVEDKGRGMSSAAVRVLLGEGVERTDGRGLGFRVVRELVGASGGRLRLRSRCGAEPGEAAHDSGTVVEISWAVASPAGEALPPNAGLAAVRRPAGPVKARSLELVTRGGRAATGRVQC